MHVTTGLGGDDVEIAEVGTPERALSILDGESAAEGSGEPFDVIVADADLRPTGGMSLSRDIKARAQMGRDMPAVVLLIDRRDDRWLSNWSQADAYVQKPLDTFNLAAAVRAVAAGEPLPVTAGVGGEPTASPFDPPTPGGGTKELAARDGTAAVTAGGDAKCSAPEVR